MKNISRSMDSVMNAGSELVSAFIDKPLTEDDRDTFDNVLRTAVACNNERTSFIAMVPIKFLRIDHAYQRTVKNNKLSKIFDINKQDPIVANIRNKNDMLFYVLDGQHRTEEAVRRGMTAILTRFFIGWDKKQEADYFVTQDDGITPVKKVDKFLGRLSEDDSVAVSLKESCNLHGLTVTNNKGIPNNIQCIGEVLGLVDRYGIDAFNFMVDTFQMLGWSNYVSSYCTPFMRYYPKVKNTENAIQHLVSRLSGISQTTFMNNALNYRVSLNTRDSINSYLDFLLSDCLKSRRASKVTSKK